MINYFNVLAKVELICYNNAINLQRGIKMSFGEEIKRIRLKTLLSQEDFAKELGVSYSTVNRWEREHTKPNYNAMKKINEYCKNHHIGCKISDKILEERNL